MVESYKIGVKLAMTGNFAQQLQVLSQGLLGINTQVKQLTGGFGKLQVAIAGAFGVWAGEKILSNLTAIAEKTADLSHELAQIQKLGGDASRDAANTNAIAITRAVRGITQSQALRIYGQTYSLLGNAHALEIQELLAKYAVAFGNVVDDPERGLAGSRDLVRAAEQMGRLTDKATGNVDMARFRQFIDLAAKIGAATEGQIGASQLYALTQQAGPALGNMTDRGIGTMAILSQYMGAHRAGTALMSLNQQFAGGTMWTRNAAELERLGILKHGEWSRGGGGGIVLSPDARRRLGTALSDPLAFVIEQILPAMDRAGITNSDDQIREVYSLFGRQTSQREIADIIRNRGQIGLELGRLDSGMGVDDQLGANENLDVKQNLRDLSAAWRDFWYALAGPNFQNEISLLKSLTGAVQSITETVRGLNPDTIKYAAEGLALLGAGLVALGSVAIVGSLVALGGTAGLLAALAAGIMTLAVINYKSISDGLSWIGEKLGWLLSLIGLGGIASKFSGGPSRLLPHWQAGELLGSLSKEATEKNTNALDNLTNALTNGFIPDAYWGPSVGGGARLTPISLTTGGAGAFNNGVYYGGGGAGGGSGAGLRAGTGSGVVRNSMGNIDSAPVPQGVLAKAAQILGNGGSSAQVQHFMTAMGYPKSGNWCGEFAAAVVKSGGGTPPPGAAIASNWRRWGQAVTGLPQVGDVAVRNGVPTGSTGSHVGFVVGVDPKNGTFQIMGGNQGRSVETMPLSRFSFRRGGLGAGLSAVPGVGGSFAAFNRIFGGTPLQGHWADVVAAAHANGIDPGLMAAIMAHETGHGTSRFLRELNNPAGLMDPANGMRTGQRFSSLDAGIDAAARTIAKNWRRAGGNLDRLAHIYAPVGAANDPHGLNGGWAAGVRSYLGRLGEDGSGAIPPHQESEIHIHQPIHLDGRKIADNTMKHIVGRGNGPAGSSRLPDYLGTRPLSI